MDAAGYEFVPKCAERYGSSALWCGVAALVLAAGVPLVLAAGVPLRVFRWCWFWLTGRSRVCCFADSLPHSVGGCLPGVVAGLVP
jgi:hypothetical protein